MLHSTKSAIKRKVGLLQVATTLQHVHQACRELVFSRNIYFGIKAIQDDGVFKALNAKNR